MIHSTNTTEAQINCPWNIFYDGITIFIVEKDFTVVKAMLVAGESFMANAENNRRWEVNAILIIIVLKGFYALKRRMGINCSKLID